MSQRKEEKARKLLDDVLNAFMEDTRAYIQGKMHDTFGVEEVLEQDPKYVRSLVFGYVQRNLAETISDDSGPRGVAMQFDNLYYQIGAQHIGPPDWTKRAKPYDWANVEKDR